MFGKLADAIFELSCELREARLERAAQLATKEDLRREGARIIKAIRAGSPQNDEAIRKAIGELDTAATATAEALDKQP